MNARNALVLVAHADDETLGCGATVSKLVEDGWSVDVVIMSESIVRARGTIEDNRAHAEKACEILGTSAPRFMDFPDQRFDATPMADLAGAVGRLGLEPDLILTHVDTDLNRDHVLTSEVAKIIGRPRKKPVSILGCEIPATSFWNGRAFAANFYVDATRHLPKKLRAFECYENEIQAYPHPWSTQALEALARYHGVQCGFEYAEAFHVIRAYEGRLP